MCDLAQLIVQIFGVFIQFLGTVVLVLTLYFYYGQLRTMSQQLLAARQQIDITRQGASGQNILALANFLQAEDVRAARTLTFQVLAKKHFTDWDDDERREAAKVCSTYGVAGAILKTGVIPGEPFFENWGASIRRSFEILLPLVREMQKPENAGSNYWSSFEWLYSQVKEKYPNLGA